jgi:competence ComEA-like helix-hairpin-helix protein
MPESRRGITDEPLYRREADNLPTYPDEQTTTAVLLTVGLLLLIITVLVQGTCGSAVVDVEHTRHRPQHYYLDINAATWPEWTLLPGIGETLARRIVASRQRNGLFRDPHELLRVKGIGPRTLENIRRYVQVPFLTPPLQ